MLYLAQQSGAFSEVSGYCSYSFFHMEWYFYIHFTWIIFPAIIGIRYKSLITYMSWGLYFSLSISEEIMTGKFNSISFLPVSPLVLHIMLYYVTCFAFLYFSCLWGWELMLEKTSICHYQLSLWIIFAVLSRLHWFIETIVNDYRFIGKD